MKEAIEKLQNEIKELEEDIKNTEDNNQKLAKKKSLKLKLQVLKHFLIYAAMLGGVTIAFTKLGRTPFKKDNIKEYVRRKTELDNMGNISYVEQYDDFDNKIDTITYASKWKKDDDGYYSRDVKIYKAKKLEPSEIKNMIQNSDNVLIEDVLGKPLTSYKERKNSITEKEERANSYLMVTIYSEDKSEYRVIKEDFRSNFIFTYLYLCIAMFGGAFYLSYASMQDEKYAEKLDKKNPYINETEKVKKLKLLKENYKNLNK